MIRTGIIGFGLSSRYLQAPFFLSNPSFELKAICTSQDLPVDDSPQGFSKVVKVDTADELIANQDLELISICSPNATHYELAKQALLSGKHVLVEKPITPTTLEAEELYQIAADRKLVLAVYQNRRFDSDFLTVQKVINSGELGDILSYSAHYNRYNPELNSKKWKEEQSPGSGILYDLGAHLIDQAITLFGTPKQVVGETFTERPGSNIDDAFDLKLYYSNLRVNLTSSLMRVENGPRYVIHGTKGSFTKEGIDSQEDHLKAGMRPDDLGFGIEPSVIAGVLKVNINGHVQSRKIESLVGSWNSLYDNLALAINGEDEFLVSREQILDQLEIITKVQAF